MLLLQFFRLHLFKPAIETSKLTRNEAIEATDTFRHLFQARYRDMDASLEVILKTDDDMLNDVIQLDDILAYNPFFSSSSITKPPPSTRVLID
jgi:hypothetical protein